MMDTPPIQSDCAFYYLNLVFSDAYSYTGTVCSDGTEEEVELKQKKKIWNKSNKTQFKIFGWKSKKNIYHNKVL